MKKNLSKNMKTANKGITLIALVITIIVLLILAGVSIATLTGENGILTQAQNAKTETEKAEAKERIQLEVLASYGTEGKIDIATLKSNLATNVQEATIGEETELPLTVTLGDYTFKVNANGIVEETTSGEVTPPSGDVILTVAPTTAKVTKNTKYQDASSGNKIAVIPAGFAVVPGCTTIDDGLVISDVANDTTDAGNQFVWIPVNEENTFERRTGKYISSGQEKTQDIKDFGEADRTGLNSYFAEYAAGSTNAVEGESKETQAEAIAMYKSVKDNGGFYIGRYEAGTTAESGYGIRGNVVCKKGANAYHNIQWRNDPVNYSIIMEKGGAVEVARSFAQQNNYDTTQVHSTLCYGVQWDTALNFIDPGYNGYAKDSTGKGWYGDNYNSTTNGNTETNPNRVTGKDLIYTANSTVIANKHKNIYDMAGNVSEWTMEACISDIGEYRRVSRGGYYSLTGSFNTASYRVGQDASFGSFGQVGFRIALYL